jgi:hypothetical protein
MIAVGMGVAWFGYLNAIYGYCLLRGWDVTWRELATPVKPYEWPKSGDPPITPASQVWPSAASSSTTAAAQPHAVAV